MAAAEALTPHHPSTAARALYSVLAIAFAIRLAVALWFPNVIAFDEVYQYLEPAHRLVFGQGFVPWEFQVGLRSWLMAAHGPFCSPWLYYMLTAQTASFSIFEKIKQQSSCLVALNQPDYYFLPLDMLFTHNTLVMPLTLEDMAHLRPGAIVSPADGFAPPDHYHLDVCEQQAANPFTMDRQADICVWLNDRPISQPPPAPLVNFYVPDVAKPFVVRDRLTN
ncbi:MAG: hypothetical protein B7Z81_13345 [Acidocella sp. 20-61-6]|nr:MAG: hypothetical protein B7Z81_13345 [Acidocella sp. 20-61-6]